MPGRLMQIDGGFSDSVWGVNQQHQIWKQKPKGRWLRIAGSLKHVSPGQGGVWGVDRSNNIVYRDGMCDNHSGMKALFLMFKFDVY